MILIHLTYLHNLLKFQPSFEVGFLLDILYINQKIYLRNLLLKKTYKKEGLIPLILDRLSINDILQLLKH